MSKKQKQGQKYNDIDLSDYMKSDGVYNVNEVFTPSSRPKFTYVERLRLHQKMQALFRETGKQIIVYGHSGTGKSSLVSKLLEQYYETHITTSCYSGMTFEQVLILAFDELNAYYVSERSQKISKEISSSLTSEFNNIKLQISGNQSYGDEAKSTRVVPLQLMPQSLARFIGEINGCWVIEDFHKIEGSERKKLSETMKIFSDMSNEYKTLRVIAVGAVDTARQVVDYNPDMSNRVAEVLVPLMDDYELVSCQGITDG